MHGIMGDIETVIILVLVIKCCCYSKCNNFRPQCSVGVAASMTKLGPSVAVSTDCGPREGPCVTLQGGQGATGGQCAAQQPTV